MDVKFAVECVDARALLLALQKLKSISGYGLTSASIEGQSLFFAVERYAMDGDGHHVGTERFVSHLALYHCKNLGVSHFPWSPLAAFPTALDVAIVEPAQEPHEYTIVDALEFLEQALEPHELEKLAVEPGGDNDCILQEAYDRGLGEGDYTPPDEWFAHDELKSVLDQALKDLPSWNFHWEKDEDRHWTLGWEDDVQYTHRIGDK